MSKHGRSTTEAEPWFALDHAVKMMSMYAATLNRIDLGERRQFKQGRDYMQHLRATGQLANPSPQTENQTQ